MGIAKVVSAVFLMLGVAVLVSGCAIEGPAPDQPVRDAHSFARPDEVAVTHLDLDLKVDFDSRTLSGTATLTLDNNTGAGSVFLDAGDLDVHDVWLDGTERAATWSQGDPEPFLGRPLEIEIEPDTKTVTVSYTTRPEAEALQWLEPRQTDGGRHPFLYTQGQSIFTRTWIPLQDSPGVRITYNATVQVPAELIAVMSAENPTSLNADGVYRFRMAQPIPAYLMALAVGDLEFRAIGERVGVYAAPELIDEAAWEFEETERMIEVAEELFGPYLWERYDILVLPAAFPFGGMENPRLTFATPTIIAGDRSLTALVAHELAHSWSGNLVTNATWDDFWLNEGFTVYEERRIMEELHGADYVAMLAALGRQDLDAELEVLDAADTRLKVDLAGRDADESFSDVPYEKGALFLEMLGREVGRERLDAFLRDYYRRFAFQSMTTERFLEHLRAELLADDPDVEARLRIDEWVYSPGLPNNAPEYHPEAFVQAEEQLQAWIAGTPPRELATDRWTTHEWRHFLRNLPDGLSADRMGELDRTFGLTESGNSEIFHAWMMQAIANAYEPAYPALEEFLLRVGRRKFLKPLYAELAKTPEGAEMAHRIYREARPGYHAVSTGTLDEILGWENGSPEE